MSFSGERTSKGTLKMLTTPLFDQETWLIGVFVCFLFLFEELKVV